MTFLWVVLVGWWVVRMRMRMRMVGVLDDLGGSVEGGVGS